ncbi:MAG: hypothetical protein HY716_07415 [Planctomycetes bacterium]|nr:hypothetical protein [Planctomycetota bacterium]
MKLSSIERALEAMETLEKGRPFSLRPGDAKRKLAEELRRVCREEGISPVIIGGLAVNHHGYLRVTADVDILVARDDAAKLIRRLKAEPGWRRYAEGFKNTVLDVGLDICVEGDRTSPEWAETYPNPNELRTTAIRPLPVPALPELIALKAMFARARDDADVVELLKRHPSRLASLPSAAMKRL